MRALRYDCFLLEGHVYASNTQFNDPMAVHYWSIMLLDTSTFHRHVDERRVSSGTRTGCVAARCRQSTNARTDRARPR